MEGETQNMGGVKSKKGVYIIIAIIIILVLFFILKKSSVTPGVDVEKNTNGSVTYSNNEGSVTVGGTALPDNWPSDAPKYQNATIQYSGSVNQQTGKAGASVVFVTSDTVQAVSDFYKKELASNGWTVEQTANIGASTVISAKKDTRTFGLYIVDSGDGKVSVTIGIGM